MSSPVAARLEREKDFHNQEFSEHAREVVDKYYEVTRNSRAAYYRELLTECRGARVLEYGCGPGGAAFSLASAGARVTGIDISDVAVRQGEEEARRQRLTGCDFAVMNAEALEYDDATFDLICGTGIIHHLDLDKAFGEIARTLKPQGRAVFFEPLGHNPLINLYRRLTPALRTEDEHPLRMADIAHARRYFSGVDASYHHLFSIGAVALRATPVFGPVLRGLELLDRGLFAALPFTRRYAWIVMLEFSRPLGRARAVANDTLVTA